MGGWFREKNFNSNLNQAKSGVISFPAREGVGSVSSHKQPTKEAWYGVTFNLPKYFFQYFLLKFTQFHDFFQVFQM